MAITSGLMILATVLVLYALYACIMANKVRDSYAEAFKVKEKEVEKQCGNCDEFVDGRCAIDDLIAHPEWEGCKRWRSESGTDHKHSSLKIETDAVREEREYEAVRMHPGDLVKTSYGHIYMVVTIDGGANPVCDYRFMNLTSGQLLDDVRTMTGRRVSGTLTIEE